MRTNGAVKAALLRALRRPFERPVSSPKSEKEPRQSVLRGIAAQFAFAFRVSDARRPLVCILAICEQLGATWSDSERRDINGSTCASFPTPLGALVALGARARAITRLRLLFAFICSLL